MEQTTKTRKDAEAAELFGLIRVAQQTLHTLQGLPAVEQSPAASEALGRMLGLTSIVQLELDFVVARFLLAKYDIVLGESLIDVSYPRQELLEGRPKGSRMYKVLSAQVQGVPVERRHGMNVRISMLVEQRCRPEDQSHDWRNGRHLHITVCDSIHTVKVVGVERPGVEAVLFD